MSFYFSKQIYERFNAASVVDADDARLEFFAKKVTSSMAILLLLFARLEKLPMRFISALAKVLTQSNLVY